MKKFFLYRGILFFLCLSLTFPLKASIPGLEIFEEVFNFETFKSNAPGPLEELPNDTLNLTEAYTTLLKKLCLRKPDHPRYIHISAIDPQETAKSPKANVRKVGRLKKKFIFSLKLLEGHDLTEEEQEQARETWHIRDENKAEIIKVLKYLYYTLDRIKVSEPQRFTTGFSMILNGCTKCQSGVTEGINSAFNLLCRKSPYLAGSFEEKIAAVISQAVDESFHKTIRLKANDEETAHVVSAGRDILSELMGVSKVIEGSYETVVRPSPKAQEKLLFLFFKKFTKDYLIDIVHQHFENDEDLKLVTRIHENHQELLRLKNDPARCNPKKRKRGEDRNGAERIQALSETLETLKKQQQEQLKERFLLVQEATAWLMQKGKDGFLEVYGLNEEGTSPFTRDGIEQLLYDFGYLKQPAFQ